MNQTRIKVYGPPGTGKTTYCLDLLCDHLQAGDRVLFVSFTRAAKLEAHRRLMGIFGEIPLQATVSTIHALCLRIANIPTTCIFETQRDVKREFYQRIERMGMARKSLEQTLSIYNRLRNECSYDRSVMELAGLYDAEDVFSDAGLNWRFIDQYESWKTLNAYIDFTALLERVAVGEGKPEHYDVVIIDEAQDLTTLQWRVMDRIYKSAGTVYVVGDDDQSIYGFLGADVHTFLTWPCSVVRVLDRTYRLPQNLLTYSLKIAARIHDRYTKTLRTNVKGEAKFFSAALSEHVAFNVHDSELYLVRNEYMLQKVQDILLLNGVPYRGRYSPWSIPSVQAIRTVLEWKDRELSAHDWKILRRSLAAPVVKYVEDRYPEVVDRHSLSIIKPVGQLFTFETFRGPWWWDKFLPSIHPDILPGIKKGITEYGIEKCMNPTLELSTIHGAKGREAERVYVCDGLTDRIVDTLNTSDNEHRVFYVAVTRAKKELFLMQDLNANLDNIYTFPLTL